MLKMLSLPVGLLLPALACAQYTAFIQQDTAIKWAAECDKIVYLVPKVKDYSIKEFYLSGLEKGTVNSYLLDKDKHSVTGIQRTFTNLKKPAWLEQHQSEPGPFVNGSREWYFIKNGTTWDGYRVAGISADSCCGCDETDAIMVKQVLYYKNSRLFTYNVLLSPLCARQTTPGKAAWYPLANVAYNPEPDNGGPLSLDKDLLLIGTEPVQYSFGEKAKSGNDSVLGTMMPWIVREIVSDITNGRVKAHEPESGKIIPADKFLTWNMPVDTVLVTDNDKVRYELVQNSLDLNSIHDIRIQQEWYFNFKNEKLYSRIKSVELYKRIYFNDGVTLRGTMLLCRINY